MKSLKKTLSLVLVLVMVLGMFGIASAAKFTDDATVQYKEAVDVMSGIGAIAGFPDGSFGPTKTITRAEAAKMVAYAVLGADIAATLSSNTSSFSDVPVSPSYAWAIPSIEYLVKEGVIAGVGGGKFNPTGEISALEIGKMLLCAIGYGANGEYVGSGWDLAVAIDGAKYGIFTGRLATANALDKPASREEVALYCFNALTNDNAYLVEYSALFGGYLPKGGMFADDYTWIGREVYGLDFDDEEGDIWGRPARLWSASKTSAKGDITLVTRTPVYSSTNAVTPKALGLALSNLKLNFDPDDVDVYYNGALDNMNGLDPTDPYWGGNGVIFEVYASNTGTVDRVVTIETTIDMVIGLQEDIAATTARDERELVIMGGSITTAATGFDGVFPVAQSYLNAGNELPVLVVYYEGADATVADVQAVSIPGTVTGIITSVSSAGVRTIGGNSYLVSENYFAHEDFLKLSANATFLLDTYGNIIFAIEATTTTTTHYGVLIDYLAVQYSAPTLAEPNGTVATELVQFLDSDGRIQTLSTAYATNKNGTIKTLVAPWGSVNGSGVITVNKPATPVLFSYTQNANGQITKITAASADNAGGDKLTKGAAQFDGKYLSDDTVVFYIAGTDFAVYTGYKNAPTKEINAYQYFENSNGTIFNAIFAGVANVSTPTSAEHVFFASMAGSSVLTEDGTIFTYTDVYVNGQKTTLNFAEDIGDLTGGLYEYTVTDGIAELGDEADSYFEDATVVMNDYFSVDGATIYTNSSTKFYRINFNSDGDITSVSAVTNLTKPTGLTSVDVMYTDGTDGDPTEPATFVYFYTYTATP